MKHYNFSTHVGGRFARLLLLTVLVLIGGKAWADDTKTITPIELDKDYDVPFGKSYYSFVAPKAGSVAIVSTKTDVPSPYSSSDFTTEIKNQFAFVSGGGAKREFAAEAGVTYYLYSSTINKGASFRVTMGGDDEKLDTVRVSPAPNGVFNITGTGLLTVTFNKSVKIGTSLLTYADKSAEVAGAVRGTNVTYDLKSEIYNLLSQKAVKAGDKLSLVIKDITAEFDAGQKFGTDGSLTLEYTVPSMPTLLNNKTVPEKFLSYWIKGDEKGQLKLEFSGDLYTGENGATATLGFGSVEGENEYYSEALPLAIDGKTLTVDLTGKVRTEKGMLPSSTTKYTSVTIKVARVKDANGNLCFSDVQGSAGSYTFSLPYEDVTTDVVTEFTPKSGESLENTDNIELYIKGESALKYSGVNFAYTSNGVRSNKVVANDEIAKTTEGSGVVLSIPVPAEAKTATNVVVTLADLQSADGVERTISATYNHLKLTLVSPEKTALDSLRKGDSIVVTTNMSDKIGYMTYMVRDLNPVNPDDAIVKSVAGMVKDTVNNVVRFTQEFTFDLPLIEGHSYALEFKGYASEKDRNYGKQPVDTANIVLTGLTKPYEYSSYTLVSIDPDPEKDVLESKDDRVINVEFSGAVNMNSNSSFINTGYGTREELESIVAADEGATADTKYSKKWQLTISTSTMAQVIDHLLLSIAAEDEQGRRVKGNTGEDAQTFFSFQFDATFGIPDVTVTPASGSKVTALDTITVEYTGGLNSGYIVPDKSAILYDQTGAEVAHVEVAEQYIPEDKYDDWNYVPTKMFLILDQKVTKAGDYSFVIPAKYFSLGADMSSVLSKETTVTYTVEEGTGISGQFADNASKYDVYTTAGVRVLSTTDKTQLGKLNSGLYIINGKKVVINRK